MPENSFKIFPGGQDHTYPVPLAQQGARDSELCQKLRLATDDHRVLWRTVPGSSAYCLYYPEKLSGQIKLAFQHNGTISDGPVALCFMVRDEEVVLDPDYPDLCGLLASIHRQVGRVAQAIAEVMEYLDRL
jgi:hypothetical protein